jgi:hypothetical protein
MKAGRQDAMAALQSNDPNALKMAMARLVGGGDVGILKALADYSQNQATEAHQRGMLGVAQQNANKPQIFGGGDAGYHLYDPRAAQGGPPPALSAPPQGRPAQPTAQPAASHPVTFGDGHTAYPDGPPTAPRTAAPGPAAPTLPPGVRTLVPPTTRKDENKNFENEQSLRKELEGTAKTYQDVRRGYERVLSSQDNAAGDISLIFGYMKLLDPSSVVREGEFATAQNAASIPDRVRNLFNRALEGTRLTPEQRAMFKGQGKSLYEAADREHQARVKQFRGLATRYGLDPERVITDYGLGPAAIGASGGNSTVATRPAMPAKGEVRDGFEFLGGNPASPESWRNMRLQ